MLYLSLRGLVCPFLESPNNIHEEWKTHIKNILALVTNDQITAKNQLKW